MSIRQVQTERLLEDIIRTLHSQGTSPLYSDIAKKVSKYLSEYPAGNPLPMPLNDAIGGDKSSVEEYNKFLANLAINLDVLYETSLRQVEEVLELSESLQSQLERLRKQRSRIEGQIDDYLLGLYNTDGYFYSFSDNFADLLYVDLDDTSAQVNTEDGSVVLPSISRSSSLNARFFSQPSIKVEANGKEIPYDEIYPLSGALEDSLGNVVWGFESRTNRAGEVIATASISVGDQLDPVQLSSIEFTPYGSTSVQLFIETREGDRIQNDNWQQFGDKILTSNGKMRFGDDPRPVRHIRFTMRKTNPDYIEEKDGKLYNRYIFGAKSMTISNLKFDSSARLVSAPLFIPSELDSDIAIDAVSLDVEDEIPLDTNIDYFVAASNGEVDEEFSDLDWRPIIPVGSSEDGKKTIKFGGATKKTSKISTNPAAGDLEMIPLKSVGPTSELNPSPIIVPGADIYRIAKLEEDVLLNSLELTEGLNTTKIYSKNTDSTVAFSSMDINYWANLIKNEPDSLTVDYGEIDAGNDFFYGGDVGAVGKDIYVETFLESDTSYPTFLEELFKTDPRSRTWDVKVYLNGRPVGEAPSGTDTKQIPWTIKAGLNHIALIIRIPEDAAITSAFLGTIALMAESKLYDFGRVRLAEWKYVDFFSMKYNETGQPKTFTLHNEELISRRRPTSNYEVRYATKTGTAPVAIRFRAELSRSRSTVATTPQLKSYRIRYSYGEG